MSDEGQEPQEPQEPVEPTEPQEPIEPQEPVEPASSMDELPDWAKNEIKKLRSENAERRKAAKKAEKEAETLAQKQAEEQGEFKKLYEGEKQKRLEAEQAAQTAELSRLRQKVGHELKVPVALIDRLQGETEEELKADAEAIIAALPKPTPSGDTDAAAGTNQQTPKVAMTESELRETAARMNVNPEHLRQYYKSRGMEISE